SRSLMGLGRTTLPQSSRIDDAGSQPLVFHGAGSSHIFSAPLRLFQLNGRYYFAIDFGTDGDLYPNRKSGLMRLFRTDIPRDVRQMVGLCRDISLVTEAEYTQMERPVGIAFPKDLIGNRALEYSGIYEDAWSSGDAYAVLGESAVGDKLALSGFIPDTGDYPKFGNFLQVLVNGKLVYEAKLKVGRFNILQPLKERADKTSVELRFHRTVQLPSPDDRPIGARLERLEIKPADRQASDRLHVSAAK
ncbi:MAG TPA: hypothetical protein VKY31_07325, partial [Terriglobia bacterium]|nr:hypothetical protein [Terriglobia bacterium]